MLSRRRFFRLLGAAAAAPVAAPIVTTALADPLAGQALRIANYVDAHMGDEPLRFAFHRAYPAIGETINVRIPVRFIRESYAFTWTRDEILPVTLATADELENFTKHSARVSG